MFHFFFLQVQLTDEEQDGIREQSTFADKIKVSIRNFPESYLYQQTPEEGWWVQRPKRFERNNKDEEINTVNNISIYLYTKGYLKCTGDI